MTAIDIDETRNQHYRIGWTIAFYVSGMITTNVSSIEPIQVSIYIVDIWARIHESVITRYDRS